MCLIKLNIHLIFNLIVNIFLIFVVHLILLNVDCLLIFLHISFNMQCFPILISLKNKN